MDVGNPNNFPRLLDLCRNRIEYVRKEISGEYATDEETLHEMHDVWERYRYVSDPHTAVGIHAWENYRKQHPEPSQGLVLATAHPAKFADVVQKAINITPPLPERLARHLPQPKLSIPLANDYSALKQFLRSH
jgi:threonine synthase